MGEVDRAQSLINNVWNEFSEARQREGAQPFDPGIIVPQPPYHSKMSVLQQRLQYHFQLVEFAEGNEPLFQYPTPLTAVDKALLHELVQSFQLHDITVALKSGLFSLLIFKANVASHPVMILDRFLAVFAEFLFNDAQLGFEFRPGLVSIHHDSVTKLCKSLNVFLVFGDDYCTVSRTPIANESRKRSKEATPPSLTLHFTAEDVTLMEEMTAKYQETVDEGEPGLEGTRYTGNLGMNRSAMTGGHRQRYYVDERLRREMFEFRQTLPAYQKWRDSLDAVHDNRVTVIMGETGSGKTTQIPQFILDELLGTRNGQIVVTQPRRISAITVAERVAKERGQQVRFDSSMGPGTRLLFCTSGILLRRLHSDPTLEGVAVIVVDEIHERDCNSDFILIILKQLLAYTRLDLKLVLMSATVEAGQFQQYFKDVNPGRIPPVVYIEGTTHPVDQYFIEDAVEWTHYSYDQRDGTRLGKRKYEEMDIERPALKNPAERLKEMSKAMDNEQYLTHLGRLLASLPVHPLVGKILVYGALFRVIEPVAVIAASLTTKSAFILPGDRRSDADLDRRFLGQERQSDHYAQWQAYRGWEGAVRQGYERHYCDQHYLSMTVLQMIKRTKGQFIQTLLDSGFVKGTEKDKDVLDPKFNTYADNFDMVTAALQCGMYPNMCWVKGGRKASSMIRQKIFTVDAQLVRCHPGSCNCEQILGDFLVYFERMRSSNGPIFLLDSSLVNPLPTILFGYDFALTDLNKKESQIHVNNWMSFNVRGKTARLLQNLRILHLKYMHDVLVDNDCAHFPPDVIECFAKLIESQAQQERELAEEDDYAAPSGKGFGKGKGKGKGKGGGKGVGGGGWSVDDPFLQAQIARMQAQSGGWFAYGGAYGSSYPAPAPQVVARGPAPAVAPAGGAAAGGSQKFGPQRMPC